MLTKWLLYKTFKFYEYHAVYCYLGYGALLGSALNTLLILLVLGIVVAVVGGVLGALIKLESEKTIS